MSVDELCAEVGALLDGLARWKAERDRYRDALIWVICRGDEDSRRIAEGALGVAPGQRSGERILAPTEDGDVDATG